MAEGLLGGILGEEDEKPEIETREAAAGAEAFAAAVAARLSGADPEVARNTVGFLRQQTELLKVQKEHLEAEHHLRLANLRNQLSEQGLRRVGMRLRVAFQLFLALLGAAVGLGLIVMVYDAFHSRNVVVDPFDAPPSLAAQGLSGKVLASGLFDVITKIQAADPQQRGSSLALHRLEQRYLPGHPETGLSIGQLQRILKSRFGHDEHIEGELVQTESGGLALTIRGYQRAAEDLPG